MKRYRPDPDNPRRLTDDEAARLLVGPRIDHSDIPPVPEWPSEIIDLGNFARELQSETDRGAALVGTAVIDHYLVDVLRAFLISKSAAARLLDGMNAPLGTFSARIDATYALGLIGADEHSECHILRRIRNLFAHQRHGLSFIDEKIAALCSLLQGRLFSQTLYSPRDHFIESVLFLAGRLLSRSSRASKIKLKPQDWHPP
jgi:DNA-binding MltR family transcriptional regulator